MTKTMSDVSSLLEDNPVIVLGPGMSRIGYDETEAWANIEARYARAQQYAGEIAWPILGDAQLIRRSLESFWRGILDSKRSDRTRGRAVPDPQMEVIPPLEAVRAGLVGTALFALVVATRSLFSQRTQDVPMTSWHLARSVQRVDPTLDMESDEAPEELSFWINLLDATLERMQRIVSSIQDVRDVEGAVDLGNGETVTPTPEERHWLSFVAPDHLPSMLEALRSRLQPDAASTDPSVDGAMIEWLADYLWFGVMFDADAPMSESELRFAVAFYHPPLTDPVQNVRRPQRREHRPGDRFDELWQWRLESGDRGLEEPGRHDEFTRTARGRALRAVAATMWQTWADAEAVSSDGPTAKSLPVAMDLNYDLAMERALWETGRPGSTFHLLAPFGEPSEDPAPLSMTTIRITDSPDDLQPALFAEPAPLEKVAPFEGPVVIKLNGCRLLGSVIYSEIDAMAAILVYPRLPTSAPEDGEPIGDVIARATDWPTRSWLFLGVGFPDWIARLRVAQRKYATELAGAGAARRRRGVGRKSLAGSGVRRSLAVDLEFSEYDRSVLQRFDIEPVEADLAWFSDAYPGAHRNPGFWDPVLERMGGSA